MSISVWLLIILASLTLIYTYKLNKWLYLFLFSLLTGTAVVNVGNIGIQPVYLVACTFILINIIGSLTRGKMKFYLIPYPIWLLFVFYIVSVISSLSISSFNIGQVIYVLFIPIITMLSYLYLKDISFDEFLNALLNISLITFIYGLIDVFLEIINIPTGIEFFMNNNSIQDNTWATAFGIPRSTSFFPEPSYLAVFSALILIFCFSLWFINDKISKKMKGVIVLGLINLLLTASLSGFLVFGLSFLFLLFLILIKLNARLVVKIIKGALSGIILLTFGLTTVVFLFPDISRKMLSWIVMRSELSDPSSISRLSGMIEGYQILIEYPLLGVGLGNYVSADLTSTIAATTGLLGFTAYLLVFITLLFKGILLTIQRKVKNEQFPFIVVVFGLFIAFSSSLGHFILVWNWVLLGASIFYLYSKPKKFYESPIK